tara:strand:- start:1691 stop:1906 length:216 start_codon:yes stop_codon:yes gene_type:complete
MEEHKKTMGLLPYKQTTGPAEGKYGPLNNISKTTPSFGMAKRRFKFRGGHVFQYIGVSLTQVGVQCTVRYV